MLVLKRKMGQSIRIGDIEVKIATVAGKFVKLAVDAPKNVPVHREEVYQAIRRNQEGK